MSNAQRLTSNVLTAAAALLLLLPLPAHAGEAGDSAMIDEDYETAVRAYRADLESGDSEAAVHFNLGLAYAHLEELGRATYHLTQARFLDPGASDVRDSLTLVIAEVTRRQAEGRGRESVTRGEPAAIFWLDFFHRFKRTHVEVLLLASCWLAFGLIFGRRRMRRSARRDAVAVLAAFSLLVAASTTGYLVGAGVTQRSVVPAVVVAERPMVREGPDRDAPRTTDSSLFNGAVVVIHGSRDDWIEVELADGRTGWLPRSQVRRIEVSNQ
jgi:tetratricopeptide (TPR) repeat protein